MNESNKAFYNQKVLWSSIIDGKILSRYFSSENLMKIHEHMAFTFPLVKFSAANACNEITLMWFNTNTFAGASNLKIHEIILPVSSY